MGIPEAEPAFYASILGAVLFGIGIALTLERFGSGDVFGGLGVGGAISINLCGGLVLAVWLIGGGLDLPVRGYVFLWLLVLFLGGLSLAELGAEQPRPGGTA